MSDMLSKAHAIAAQLTEWRRTIHHHPELGFQETKTAAYAAEALRSLGYRVRTGVGKTGVAADYGAGGPLVAIRADMDALPILEANETPYASEVPGVMHACGHDSHTAMALGAATLLRQMELPGTVRILIQPSEEANDAEGLSGAPRMIHDGAMEGVRHVIALHVDPSEPAGMINIGAGPASGGVDSFFATIYGHGGHGASPQKTVDPVYLTGHVLLALHGIVSRRLDPFAPAVVTVGAIHGGQAENVIPDQVDLAGTIRYMEKAVREKIHAEIESALSIARVLGGDYRFKLDPGTPPMINDAAVTGLIQRVATELLGPQGLTDPRDGLGAEDFGCFSEVAPGAMFSLGCRIEGDERLIHNPRFDIDERCLPVGAAILAESAYRLMQQTA